MKPTAATPWLLLAYLIFVVYGSLVPLEFKPLAFDVAWDRFQHIPFLKLGLESRADWVANGVLYAPLGFLISRALSERGSGLLLAALAAAVAACVLAVGVEFTQLWFPQRTVSLNDILAECIGGALGAFLAPALSGWLDRLLHALHIDSSRLLPHLLELYAVAYVLLCFFPYDLLLSTAELQGKWHSNAWAWVLAPQERGGFFTVLQLALEVILVMPIGALPYFRPGATGQAAVPSRASAALAPPLRAMFAGALLGLFIELGQFFVASAVSQGASVLTRALGVAAGCLCVPWLQSAGWTGVRAALRPWAWWLVPPYLVLLAAASGFFRYAWHGPSQLAASWQSTHLLPFYYHYFTSESLALFSLTSVALMYLPVAALGWVRGASMGVIALTAAALASAVEAAKLFQAETHADPTNILVAVMANLLATALLAQAQRPAAPGLRAGVAAELLPSQTRAVPGDGEARPALAGLWLLAPLLATGSALFFPVFPLTLFALLSGLAALIWRWPVLALGAVPLALPVLDWAPWSGRFFWDEFDLLQLVCLGVALFRTAGAATESSSRSVKLAFALLGLSLTFSGLRAFWPLPALDDNSFASYYSAFNALRILKGAVWACLFMLLWQRLGQQGERRARVFTVGLSTGLALTLVFVMFERLVFAGLLDFAADFRVTGPFSAMHKGGAYIECFLAVCAAFVVSTVLRPGPAPLRTAALLLLAGSGYAMLVTYSRNGYAALAMVVLVSVLAMVPQWRTAASTRHRIRQFAFAAALVLVMAAVMVPMAGGYARQRLSQSSQDLGVRQAHWADGLAMRNGGVLTDLLGMGVGRFPERHYWSSREALHAASYTLGRDGATHYLRLAQGATLYIEQIVARPEIGALRLSLDWRGAPGQAPPVLALCEKWTLTSLACATVRTVAATVPPVASPPVVKPAAAAGGSKASPAGGWQELKLSFDASALVGTARALRAPLKLALLTPERGSIDITKVRLSTALGDELLVNGDFAAGMDRWFFATDVDPPWHLHSLPVAVLFDQGWLGVLTWLAVGLLAFGKGAVLLWRGQAQVPAALAALAGFATSGTLNTLIDAPRFLWLLLVLLWLAAARKPAAVGQPAAPAVVGAIRAP